VIGEAVGGGLGGMFATTGTFIAINGAVGGVSTVAGNALAGKEDMTEGAPLGTAIGAAAPLMSG